MASTPKQWDVENDVFWDETGKRIANRNLWISIPNLLCGFSVWLYWGMIAKTMQRLHFANEDLFAFASMNSDGLEYGTDEYIAWSRALLFTFPAVAGLAVTHERLAPAEVTAPRAPSTRHARPAT